MKRKDSWKRTATEHAEHIAKIAKRKDTQEKQGSVSDTAAEHATSGNATEHAAFASGTATEHASSTSGAKDPRLEKMFQEACSNAPPKMHSLFQELHALGRYPNRYKQPANKIEKDSNSLAKKLATACSSFTLSAQKYVEAMRSTSNATERAQHAESLMLQVRNLGHYPRESLSEPEEQLLAQQLRKAKANGLLVAYEEELEDFAAKLSARIATEHAKRVESLMQQVRNLGHYPRESQSEPQEQMLARQLRDARARGLPVAFEEELRQIAAADTRFATEHAKRVESLMQQVRNLGHYPRESQSEPQEQMLARQLRDAKAHGLPVAFEEELRQIAAANAKAMSMRLASERARAVTTLHKQILAATELRGDLHTPSAVARHVRKMAADRRVQQSPAMQALVEEMEWALARRTQQLRAERLAARAREKQWLRRARQQELRSRCKRTMQRLKSSSLRCNCHDFACWKYLWQRDPEIATTLRQTGHHLPFCKLSLEEWQAHQRKDILCPYSGFSFDEVPSDDGEKSGDEYNDLCLDSDDELLQGDFTLMSLEGGPTWVREQGEDYVYRRRKTPGGFALLEPRAVRDATEPPVPDEGLSSWMPIGDATEHPAPGDGLQCCVSHPARFLDYGIHSRCQACFSTISCGLLFGGRCDGGKYLKEYMWAEISFRHASKSCAPNIPFPGRVSREWLQHLAHPVGIKLPGSDVGVSEAAYNELMKFCGARADCELLHYSFNFAGRLLRSTHPPASSALCCRALHWNGDGICVQPAVRSRQRPLKLKPEFQMDDGDVANHWKHMPLTKVRAADPIVLYRLAEAAVNTLGRWPRLQNASSRTEARLAKLLETWIHLPSGTPGNFFCRSKCLARIAELFRDCSVPRGAATEHSLASWRKDVEFELMRMGLGVAGVDAQEVFHHSLQGWPKPKKQLSTDQQRNLLAKANLLQSSSAETPEHKAHDLAKFFLWDADFQTYNEERMTAHDPNAHKWSTGKKLLDYTPHVTKEDWLNALSHERFKTSMRNSKLRERWGNNRDMLQSLLSKSYGRQDAVWTHFSSDEIAWACNAEPRYATEQPAPYKPFLDNDWCRYCLWPRYQGWSGGRRPSKAESSKMYDMWFHWNCQPYELLWVGGTYARDPKYFPACQQETEWIYAKLRPLHIQPPIELMRIHFARPWCGPDWPAPRFTRKQGVSVEACGVQLYKYMKRHGMLWYPSGLWYGYDLPDAWFRRSDSDPSWRSRSKSARKWGEYEQPAVAALDHPKTPATAWGNRCEYPFLLPSAKRLEQMPHAECAATEHAFEIKCRDKEDAECLASEDSDFYGTLT